MKKSKTVAEVLEGGFWAGFSIYPSTKMGNVRMVEILRHYGAHGIDSACDWGISEPLGVPKTAQLAVELGIPEATVHRACYENALAAYGQSWQMKERDWLSPPPIDQRTLFEGNSVLRGRARRKSKRGAARGANHRMIFASVRSIGGIAYDN